MNDVPDALINSNSSMLADDLKMLCRVKTILDATKLQRFHHSANAIVSLCKLINLKQ